MKEGEALAVIRPAIATQADGTSLRASYAVSGNVLVTHVDLSGSVAFPVLVDPTIVGSYGSVEGANTWAGWASADSCGGCFSLYGASAYRVALVNPGAPVGASGAWYIAAPGHGLPGSSLITRVDLRGVRHSGNSETTFLANIEEGNGSNPVWTYNGLAGAQGSSPLVTGGNVEEAIAFCAQGAGGNDGGEQPLCNENYGGLAFINQLSVGPGALNEYGFYEFTGASVRFLDTTPPNEVALHEVPANWVKKGPSSSIHISASDQGLGIQSEVLEIPPGYVNSEGKPFFAQEFGCSGSAGFDGCSQERASSHIDLSGLATGVYTLGAYAWDPTSNYREASPSSKLYIDNTPPKFTAFGGSLYEANGSVIGNGNYTLTFGAEDGSTSAPQIGVQLIVVFVDGSKVTEVLTSCSYPSGVPSSGCFALNGSWTMEGQKYGAGVHTISVTAKDWLGNEKTESFSVTVNEAPYEGVGPGSVNARTGDFKLTATDVAVASPGASLMLGRAYDSRQLTQGATGPLGPQWNLSVPDAAANSVWQSLKVLGNGSVRATSTRGGIVVFSLSGSTYMSPLGYQTIVLTKTSSSPLEYRITDGAGNATIFTRASSGEESEPVLVPSGAMQATGAGGLNKVTYTFTKTSEGIVEPTKVLAPYPATINCLKENVEELVAGCRELTFNYATSTTATGERAAGWGDYKGRLTRVYFTGWDTTAKAMTTTTVAQYSYDTKGRLRAEWDPLISPALKTEYGYDSEGHVSAVTAPGQESWIFTYGATSGDSNTGRLLKVLQAPASAALWNGEITKNTEAPHISGSPVVGVRMTVSDGAWSQSPVSFAYQWMDCNAAGGECAPIPGATNPNYTPTSNDVGHTLVAQVAAANGGGTTAISSAASGRVTAYPEGSVVEGEARAPQAGATIEYNVPLSGTGLPTMTSSAVKKWGQKDIPAEATAIFPPDEAQSWPASDYKRAIIYYLDNTNRAVNVSSPTGGISTTEFDSHNNRTRELTASNRATALKELIPEVWAEVLSTNLSYSADGTELTSTLGPLHKVKLPSGSEVEARKQVAYKYDEGAPTEGGPYRLVTSTKEAAIVSGKEEDVRTVTKAYNGGTNLGWKLHQPTSTITDPTGLKLTYNTVYSSATGAVLETQTPGGGTGNTGAHTSQIVYYTPAKEASVAVCQNHPEWANMPCQSQPAHQPEAGGLPNIPVTIYTYNIWDQAEITKSINGEAVRTEIQGYDTAGRLTNKKRRRLRVRPCQRSRTNTAAKRDC